MRLAPALGLAVAAAAAVAVALSAGAAADNNTGARVSTAVRVGSVALTATSTAPAVRFAVDGVALKPTAVTHGSARAVVATWGLPNGTHSASVRDCAALTSCHGNGSSATFTVANSAPAVTAPGNGSSVLGGFTVRASAPGGTLKLVIDGRSAGFANGPRYSFSHTSTALTPGKHTLQVIECSTDHAWCAGPISPAVRITSQALRAVVSASPSSISPNRDGVNDSTSLQFALDRAQTVTLTAIDSRGRVVEAHQARTFSKGVHHWRWRGLAFGHTAPDGTYTLQVASSARINGAVVKGVARASVQVDTRKPVLSSISGDNSTLYPYRDGNRDTFTPTLTLSERANLKLTVRNSRNQVVGTATATAKAGRASITWNGQSSGRAAPAGRYTWTITATDSAGNSATSSKRTVTVSNRALVAHTVTLTQNGSDNTDTQLSSNCSTASTQASSFRPRGVLLRTTCSPATQGPQVAAAEYTFTLPSATRYGTISMRVTGSSADQPSQIEASVPSAGSDDVTLAGMATVTSSSRQSYALGRVAGSTHVSGNRGNQVHVVLSVDDLHVDSSSSHASSFDIDSVQITATYYTLT